MKSIFFTSLFLLFVSEMYSENTDYNTSDLSADWQMKLYDNCKENWQNYWVLDGLTAKVSNSEKGMNFTAGMKEKNDSSHAVLWSKDVFEGDIKIEFEYTRLDSENRFVNILYIYARGTGEGPFTEDISEWNDLRSIPAMRTYYNNMYLLHISFAAFKNSGIDSIDYIRIRHYPVEKGKNFNSSTGIPPLIENTGLFKTGVPYKITVIKSAKSLYFKIEGESNKKIYSWDIEGYEIKDIGRIGIRHMCMRSALYNNIKVYTKNK